MVFLAHVASNKHETAVHGFCVHHKCDPTKELRLQLTLSQAQYQQLINYTDNHGKASERPATSAAKATTEPAVQPQHAQPTNSFGTLSSATMQSGATSAQGRERYHPATLQRETAARPQPKGAFGCQLTSIARVHWSANVANVHSPSAVPPWMVTSEDEYKRINTRQTHKQATKEARDIFAKLSPQYDEHWLPNFGSVWQSGPRSTTKRSFQELQQSSKERPAKKTIMTPSVPPVSTPPPVDKREALLAQKERLRARFAAKKATK